MADDGKRDPKDQTRPFADVCEAERHAIEERRRALKNRGGRDRTASPATGLALSGGGIRSASFSLGVLQALQAKHANHPIYGIEGMDYLSTVSGGGYIGASLTAALQDTGGKFPFTNVDKPDDYGDTDSVHHIRDYSNYLMPRGLLDVVTALGIIGRGMVANWLIAAPVLLFFVWITLFIHPSVGSLNQPLFLKWNLANGLAALGFHVSTPLWGMSGYWFTLILLAADLAFLIFWAFARSLTLSQFRRSVLARIQPASGAGIGAAESSTNPANRAELSGLLVWISNALFILTLTAAWLETQPFILHAMALHALPNVPAQELTTAAPAASLGEILRRLYQYLIPALAPIGAIFAFLSKYLADMAELARRSTGWQAWTKRILAMAALWFAAIIIPSLLWLIYLELTFAGLAHAGAFPFAPEWFHRLANAAPFQGLLQRAGLTAAAGVYFEAFVLTGLLALLLNPNVTSLYRFYRDRLSKAFLFRPDPRLCDKHGDLQSFEPKLHKISTGFGPYHILNATLNLEGSQFANRRGRNGDVFIFTPKFTGSEATRYIETGKMEEDENALDLGTAMAISGAAVSSNMGLATIKPLAFTLAFLNVRLGYWLRNPRFVRHDRSLLSRMADVRSFLLFKEMFGWISEKSPTVYLTDGGHIENLGIYSLMRRRCDVIIAVDAEADPQMTFNDFLRFERYARIDLGVNVNLPWKELSTGAGEINKTFAGAKSLSAIPDMHVPHCAACDIDYGSKQGLLLLIKSSLSGDEPDYILDYKRRYPAFPHETTADQFFGEEQLEAYRALGFHIMRGLLTGDAPFAVEADTPEAKTKKQADILRRLQVALLGTNVKVPAAPH